MCGPWAGAALFGLAGLAKYAGEKQAEHARDSTFNAEKRRQDAFTAEQTGRFQDSLDATRDVASEDGQKKAALAREGSLAAAIVPAAAGGSYLPGSSSAPAVVATAADKASGDSHAASVNLAHTLAALGGTTDQMQGAGIKIGRNSQDIGQVGGFKAGSANVLDAEMRAASHKGEFLRTAGGLAQQIAMAYITGGMGGGGGPGAVGGMTHEAGSHLALAGAV